MSLSKSNIGIYTSAYNIKSVLFQCDMLIYIHFYLANVLQVLTDCHLAFWHSANHFTNQHNNAHCNETEHNQTQHKDSQHDDTQNNERQST
jgi:hypothetical protein